MAAEAFPADSGLPALTVACDGRRIAELLRAALPGFSDDAAVQTVALEGFRHRRGQRSMLKYRVSLAGGADAESWVTGRLYGAGGRAQAAYRELAAAPTTDWDGPLPPFGFVPELDMLLETFPFDRKLPTLPALAKSPPPGVAALLTQHARLSRAAPGEWTSEAVRYRPGIGAVLRWTLVTEHGAVRFYAKVFRPGDDAESVRRLLALDGAAGGFDVCRPVAHGPELSLVVLAEVPGTPLDRLLLDGHGADAGAALRCVARALAALHRGRQLPERRYTAADEVGTVDRAVRMLRWARPDVGGQLARIADGVARGLDDVLLAPTHRDLKPDHVLLGDGRPSLVDLDSVAAADPLIDPATLLARLFGLPFEQPLSRHRAHAAMHAFADEYFSHVPASWRVRLGPHLAGALLELAAGLFRRQVPGWSGAVDTLVAEAARAVAQGA